MLLLDRYKQMILHCTILFHRVNIAPTGQKWELQQELTEVNWGQNNAAHAYDRIRGQVGK